MSTFNPNTDLTNNLITLEYLIQEKQKWLDDAKSHVKVLKDRSQETKFEHIEEMACPEYPGAESHYKQLCRNLGY